MNRQFVLLLLVTMALGTHAPAQATGAAGQEPLPAPLQKMQTTTLVTKIARLEWEPVAGAATYGIEIDCLGCCVKHHWCSDKHRSTFVQWMVQSPYIFNIPVREAGSWRVWAVDKTGRAGNVSDWSLFAIGGNTGSTLKPPKTHSTPKKLPMPMVLQIEQPRDSSTGELCTWPMRTAPAKEVTPPKTTFQPEPAFTERARKEKIVGSASMLITVGSDGNVKRACLLEAVQPDLGDEAIQTVRTWRFQPAQKNGEPVEFETFVEVSFMLYPWLPM